jgi:hypothetical protein
MLTEPLKVSVNTWKLRESLLVSSFTQLGNLEEDTEQKLRSSQWKIGKEPSPESFNFFPLLLFKSMANTRDIRLRIKGVKSTRQITRAMQMVATSKMKKAQDAAKAVVLMPCFLPMSWYP